MDSSQLTDSLSAHIALYHSSTPPSSLPLNPRKSILRWFSSLTVHQRQSYLTVVDSKFVEILIQMQSRLQNQGHGLFIILPDLPSPERPSLPSLCFRRSRGLLSRVSASNESERWISPSVLMFGSNEGENSSHCSCSASSLDSVTVSEDLVGDLDRFVAAMDGVSNGEFLRGEQRVSGSEWEELPWLKAKGYYSIEAFVANKLEVALRLSWLNCHGGKRRGVKSKEKASAALDAANVFWRKKGHLNWWTGLDTGLRKKIVWTFLSQAAKPLANEIVKGKYGGSKDEMEFFNVGAEQPLRYGSTASYRRIINPLLPTDAEFCLGIFPASVSGKPASLANLFNGLLVFHEISTMKLASQHSEFEMDRLFFSSLGSVNSVSDCILRTLRGLLVAVSRDCVNLELLGDENLKLPLTKSIEKSGGNARRGKNKGRNQKRLNPVSESGVSDYSLQKSSEELGCKLACREGNSCRHGYMLDTLSREANGRFKTVNGCILEKDLCKEMISGVEMEHTRGLVDHKVQITGKKSRKERSRSKISSLKGPVTVKKVKTMETTPLSVIVPSEFTKSSKLIDAPTVPCMSNDSTNSGISPNSSSYDDVNKTVVEDGTEVTKNIRDHLVISSTTGNCTLGLNGSPTSIRLEDGNMSKCGVPGPEPNQEILHNEASPDSDVVYNSTCYARIVGGCITSSVGEASDRILNLKTKSPIKSVQESGIFVIEEGLGHRESGYLSSNDSQQNCEYLKESSLQPVIPVKLIEPVASNDESEIPQKKDCSNSYSHGHTSSGGTSYEWPSLAPVHFPAVNSQHLPAATDRLHLDVGRNCRSQFHQTFVTTRHQARNPSIDAGCSLIVPSRTLPMSLDWPPMVRNASRLSPSLTCNYDSGYVPRLQSSFRSGFTAHGMQLNGIKGEEERKCSGDFMDLCNLKNAQDQVDDNESHWISEEEPEVHAFSGRDYNQFFGGGVMYWNTCDLSGTGFSRPPSLSSEDSSWAWHEAELNRAIDDMVGLPASYSASGMASPPAAPFCSPFEPLGPGHQPLGYVIPGNDVAGKVLNSSAAVTDVVPEEKGSSTNSPGGVVEGITGDSLSYPILRPIVVPNFSRPGSRAEFKINHGHNSPCKLPTRRDPPRIKRPPSPVVLCVPAPRPPPPSPISESRKQRGFPTVRSGSSSPRHWGMRSWFHDGTNCDEPCLSVDGADVIWPSWRSKGLVATPMIQPLPESLLQDPLIAISQLALDKEHPDVALPLQPPDLLNCPVRKTSLSLMHSILHEEIDTFCKQVAAENMTKKPYINWAVKRVARSLQVLWPRSRTNIFGSTATGLALPMSDVDLVVCLPPVRNLEPIKEAGILEGRNGIKETCLQHAARYLANQEWVKSDSLKTVENTAIPVIMLVAEVPHDLLASSGNTSNVHAADVQSTQMTDQQGVASHPDIMVSDNSWSMRSKMKHKDGMDRKSVRLDISFKSPSHTGLQTTELVRELTEQFPAAIPLALVLKQFLADRSLDHSYSGGLSSYCLVLLITRFLQHELHIGQPINQNLGSLLMDFLYFFGNVFDPRQMRVSIQGSGVYVNRERGQSIDPIHIDDPLYPTNNVGRNCFRIHQCVKAFADAYSVLENELTCLPGNDDPSTRPLFRLLPKIIPNIDHL